MEIQPWHIICYLEDKLSAPEKETFEQLLKNSGKLRQELEEMRSVWEMSEKVRLHKQIDTAGNWKKISRRIALGKYGNKVWKWSRNAAAVLLFPVLVTAFYFYHTLKEQDREETGRIELTSAHGLVSKVTLPDGSGVWLNSGSTLAYPQRFTAGKRQVYLSGEAYFNVKSDPSDRFEVITDNGLKIAAYGTEFNVYAYEEEKTVEATLVTGNLEISSTSTAVSKRLLPGQQALFNKENKRITTADVNLTVKTAWKDGKMIFRRAGMTEITRRLSRHFNVDIRLEGEELYDYEYSATFTTETLTEILGLLEKSAPIQCRIIEPEQSEDYSYSKRIVLISMRKKR